ncbi:MAG: hypothetical protein C0613_06855 [Desulfobulbaceae bacterium]|nr:MAG: hypothetical protein C0613_06855 [Desulfobulbaceae bacterium]
MPNGMNSSFIHDGLLGRECIDPGADVQLLVELVVPSAALCVELAGQLQTLPCRVEWCRRAAQGYCLYILADPGVDKDRLLARVALLVDGRQQIALVETRLVQKPPLTGARHGFSFVDTKSGRATHITLAGNSHAFGSGNHPSTALVVELLEELPEVPSPVLDVGCGTGVLSLVAARLGAASVLGLDIDAEAVATAVANAAANNLSAQTRFTTSPLAEVAASYALILANLTASVLYRLLADMSDRAAGHGRLIVSGLQGRQGDEVEELAGRYGWRLVTRRCLGKWQARLFVMTRQE